MMKQFWKEYKGWILTILLLITILIGAKLLQMQIDKIFFEPDPQDEKLYEELQPYEWVD